MSGLVCEWIGTAMAVAPDLGRRATGSGFPVLAVSSLFWLTAPRTAPSPERAA